jgi:hypothetical protein
MGGTGLQEKRDRGEMIRGMLGFSCMSSVSERGVIDGRFREQSITIGYMTQ